MSEAVAETTASEKRKTEYVTVQMDDGRSIDFATTIKAKKTTIDAEGNDVTESNGEPAGVRWDFVNGQTRTVMLSEIPGLVAKAATHGISQKGGDSYASEKDVDDAVEALDDTLKTLREGKWTEGRQGGFGGVGILVKALAEVYGKDYDTVRAIIKDMTPREKQQLRQVDGVREVVQRLESEKAASSGVDTAALVSKFQ